MNISINKPCHEDWDKMTPNEQGAFCGVCTKNVIDFSKKSIEEIKAFFAKPSRGKLCGRFTDDQLVELNAESFVERFLGFRLTRKIATLTALAFVALVMTSSPTTAQSNSHIKMGKVKPPVTQTVTPVKMGEAVADTTKTVKNPETVKGEVSPTCTDPKKKTKPKNKSKTKSAAKKPEEPKPHMMGDVDINYDPNAK